MRGLSTAFLSAVLIEAAFVVAVALIGDTLSLFAPFDSMRSPLVWCYVPSDGCNKWEPPFVCEEDCPTLDDAHSHARVLRQHYPGHLFAVTDGRRPLSAR